MAGTMGFLADGITFFAPGTILEPWPLPPVIEPKAPSKFNEPWASGVICAAAAEAIARGTIPLLSFTNYATKISASNGRFREPFTCAPETFAGFIPFFSGAFGRFAKTFPLGSAFLFFKTSMETGAE
jgi:hypothetical protein